MGTLFPVLSIGISLEDDIAQVCCLNPSTKEAESLCTADDHMNYQIPIELFKLRDEDTWLFGKAAHERAIADNRTIIKGFAKDYASEDLITANGAAYRKRDLLKVFFVKLLSVVKAYYPEGKPGKITFALRDQNGTLAEDLKDICSELKINRDDVEVISFAESYASYALCQKEELWTRGTGLFEYDRDGLHYYALSIRKYNPRIVEIRQTDLSSFMGPDDYKIKDFTWLDETFKKIVKDLNVPGNVSAVYLSGRGFSTPWQKESIKSLCNGSRLFAGQNLYSKGACLASYLRTGEMERSRFILLSDTVCKKDISVYVYTEKGYAYYPVCKTGQPLASVDEELDIMLYKTENVWLFIRDIVNNKDTFTSFRLDGISNLNDYSGVCDISFKMDSPRVLSVKAKDKGFGIFIQSSGKTWNKKVYTEDGDVKESITTSGRVMYIRKQPGETPYYFKDSRAKVYTYEQLCYYIRSNIQALDRSLFNEELYYWISKYTGRRNMAKVLKKSEAQEASFKSLINTLLSRCVLFEAKDMEDLLKTIDLMEHQNPIRSKKAKADNLLRYKHYRDAISLYLSAIRDMDIRSDREEGEGMNEDLPYGFEASLYHDLGVAYTRLLDFKNAGQAFLKAYESGVDNSELQNYILCLKALNDNKKIRDIMATYDLTEETVAAIVKEYNDALQVSSKAIMSISADQKAYLDKLKRTYRDA